MKYTDAQFAACLLSCGPHCVTNEHGTVGQYTYRERVYKYFFVLFPRKAEFFDTKNVNHQWLQFWREYIEWVKS